MIKIFLKQYAHLEDINKYTHLLSNINCQYILNLTLHVTFITVLHISIIFKGC